MFCTNCGNQLKDGVKFCNKCGKAVGAKTVPVRNAVSESNRKVEIPPVEVKPVNTVPNISPEPFVAPQINERPEPIPAPVEPITEQILEKEPVKEEPDFNKALDDLFVKPEDNVVEEEKNETGTVENTEIETPEPETTVNSADNPFEDYLRSASTPIDEQNAVADSEKEPIVPAEPEAIEQEVPVTTTEETAAEPVANINNNVEPEVHPVDYYFDDYKEPEVAAPETAAEPVVTQEAVTPIVQPTFTEPTVVNNNVEPTPVVPVEPVGNVTKAQEPTAVKAVAPFNRVRPVIFMILSGLLLTLWNVGGFKIKALGGYTISFADACKDAGNIGSLFEQNQLEIIQYLSIGIMAATGVSFLLNLIELIIGKKVPLSKAAPVLTALTATGFIAYTFYAAQKAIGDFSQFIGLDVIGWMMIGVCVFTILYAISGSFKTTSPDVVARDPEAVKVQNRMRIKSVICILLAAAMLALWNIGGVDYSFFGSHSISISQTFETIGNLGSMFGNSDTEAMKYFNYGIQTLFGLAILLNLFKLISGKQITFSVASVVFSGLVGLAIVGMFYYVSTQSPDYFNEFFTVGVNGWMFLGVSIASVLLPMFVK